MITTDNFQRITNDINGNPRYVCHYSHLSMPVDSDSLQRYELALTRAKKLGGKRYHTKAYSGGIVFQSYNLQDICDKINHITEAYYV